MAVTKERVKELESLRYRPEPEKGDGGPQCSRRTFFHKMVGATPVRCSVCDWCGKLDQCNAGTEEVPALCPTCNEGVIVVT